MLEHLYMILILICWKKRRFNLIWLPVGLVVVAQH